MIARCTTCAAEDVEVYGVQRVCAKCKLAAEKSALEMAALLRQWLSYSVVADDVPMDLVARTYQVLQGIPQ